MVGRQSLSKTRIFWFSFLLVTAPFFQNCSGVNRFSLTNQLSSNTQSSTAAAGDGGNDAGPNFMAMLVNHLVSGNPLTPWPSDTPIKSLRLWDTGVAWGEIQPTNGSSFNWTSFDTILNLAASHNADILYTFGNTPAWSLGKNISISSVVRSANVVTLTTSAPHGLSWVNIYAAADQSEAVLSGVSDASFNGTFVITGTPTPTTLTFAQKGVDVSSAGGAFSAQCTGVYSFRGECAEAPYNLDDWDNFVTAIATRANGRIKYWEMWNQANLAETWRGSSAVLVTMVQHARSIIKKIDPQAVILSPSVLLISQAKPIATRVLTTSAAQGG